MRRITLSALALVGSLGVAGIARAGCCDDFWSCAAAVATGGLTCQIQSIIDTVNSMKTLVETMGNTLRNQTSNIMAQAQTAVGNASNDMKNLREQAMANLQKQADQAHEIATPPNPNAMAMGAVGGATIQKNGVMAKPLAQAPGAAAGGLQAAPIAMGAPPAANANAAALPKTADAQALKDALVRADTLMKDIRSKANAPAAQVAQAEAAAVSAAARHLQAAGRISLDLAITPLNILRDSLLDLLSHPERIFDPSAQINADIQRITAQVPAMLDRITNEVTQEAIANLNGVKDTLQQVQDSAASGQTLVDTMQRAANSKLQPDLDALERLVPRPPPAASGPVVAQQGAALRMAPAFVLPPAVVANNRQLIAVAITRADPAKLPIVVQQRAAVADLAAKWQSVQTMVRAPAPIAPATVQKVDRDLGQMFVGKSGGDIAKKKSELLEEANKRFAKDPKTLEKVRQYIETHAPKG
jgi:hypothetical protein